MTIFVKFGTNYHSSNILGDFNQILDGSEKVDGSDSWQRGASTFWKVLEDCDLTEVGFSGSIFNSKRKLIKSGAKAPPNFVFLNSYINNNFI